MDVLIDKCYATGQACVFLRNLRNKPCDEEKFAFLISPFTAEHNHLFNYHLNGIDLKTFGIKTPIIRADTFAKTGYVMCTRICFNVQNAELIICDITEENLNVFYELGLSIALNKKLFLIAHDKLISAEIKKFIYSFGLAPQVSYYSSNNPISKFSDSAQIKPIDVIENQDITDNSVLIYSNDYDEKNYVSSLISREQKICDFFLDSITEILHSDIQEIKAKCKEILSEKGDEESFSLLEEKDIKKYIDEISNNTIRYQNVQQRHSLLNSILKSEFVLLDVSNRDFETYFWLGYCHGSKKVVIPLSLSDGKTEDKVLPFDVRTLWHVYGNYNDPISIKSQIKQILLEIISKKITDNLLKNKIRFWDSIIRSGKISFYIGTESSSQLQSKQVTGEWDVRAFQEISSFCPKARPKCGDNN